MGRVEENKGLLDLLGKQATLMNDLKIEPTDSYNIGNMFVILVDISKSLAVIADKISEEK